MSDLWLVIEREFVQRVRSRSFLISTAIAPLFMAAIFLGPLYFESRERGGEQTLVVVDESPAGVGERIAERLGAAPERERDAQFRVERRRVPLAGVRDSLNAAVLDERIDGYLWLPPGILQGEELLYRARNVTNFRLQDRIEGLVSESVQLQRLDQAGLRSGEVASLLQPVPVRAARITAEGEEGGSAAGTLLLSLVAGFLLYFLILLYGAQVMQSVQEEKTNRIAEVLVSSIRASDLMLGKVLGVGAVALLQVAIWAAFAGLLFAQRERVASAFGVPAELPSLGALGVAPGVVTAISLFALAGFFLYAALFAAAGAAAESSEDAQRFTFPLITPLLIPILAQQAIVSNPQGTLAVVLGWIPLTSPIVMPMRLGSGVISTVEIVGSLLVLAASVALLGWLAGKIYRIGILSTGKRPSMRELGRWLRTA